MKQCRYCIWLFVNNRPYCEKKKKFRSESSCKRANDCEEFELAECEQEYQDAFMETKGYRPRKKKKKQCDGQINLFMEGNKE